MTANLENVGVYLTQSSPVLSQCSYHTSVTESSVLCIVESDGSHSVSCHTLFQTWQPYLPDNCLRFGGESKWSLDSEIVLPPVRTLITDFIPSRGSSGSQQLFSVSKTAQDLINDYLEQETNPNRPVTVYPKRKIKDIDVTRSSHKSSIHTLDKIIDSTPIGNIRKSKAVDTVTISPTDHFRAEAHTSKNEASKNRGHVKAKCAASSAKSITHRNQSRSSFRRCHAHTWASNSRCLDQSDSTGWSSLDVTAAAKSLGEALAAKLQALLYSGTSNHKCSCECGCQTCVGEDSRSTLMSDKQNEINNSPGALCYKSPSQKPIFSQDDATTVHSLCKPPCRVLTCGERSKCNEQLNKKTPTEVNTFEPPSPAETQPRPLVSPLLSPILKDSCPGFEKCKPKTPPLTTCPGGCKDKDFELCEQSPILKDSCPGSEKCKPKTPPLTTCPGGCKDKDFELCEQSPILKDSCPGSEKCKPKTPPLTTCPGGCKDKDFELCEQSPILKDSCPGSDKCIPKTQPLTRCPCCCTVKNSEPGIPKPSAQGRPYRSGGYEIPTPCRVLTCGERSKCNKQLNKKTPTEVNTFEAPSSAETQPRPLVSPSLKGCCTDSENCRVKIPEFQARLAKSPCLGPGKCKNESQDPQTKCPGGGQVMSQNISLSNFKTEINTSKDIVQNQQYMYSESKPRAEAPILKDSCPGFEKCKPKTPPLTRCPGGCKDKDFELCEQSPILKDSCPGSDKCIPKTQPLTRCPCCCTVKNSEPGLPEPSAQGRPYRSGGYEIPTPRQAPPESQVTFRKVSSPGPRTLTLSTKINISIQADLPNDIAKPSKEHVGRRRSRAIKTFEQQCPSIPPSVVSLCCRCPPSQVPAPPSGSLKGLKIEVRKRNVGTGSNLPSPGLSCSTTGVQRGAKSTQKKNTSKNLRNIGVGLDRPLSDTKISQSCGPNMDNSSFSGLAKSIQDTNTRPEIINATQACGDDYMPKETSCAPAVTPAKYIISEIKLEQGEKSTLICKIKETKSVDTGNCCACVTYAKSFEERHTNTQQSQSNTATEPGTCGGDLELTITQQRGTDPGLELGSGELDPSNSCYVIFKRTKSGLLRLCSGLRNSKEKKISCTGKCSSDSVSKIPTIKISQSVAHKTSKAIKKSTLRSCCSCAGEVQAKAKIPSRSIGVGSDICLRRPTHSATMSTSQCAIVPDPVKPKCCKAVEPQMITPQCIVSDPVKLKCCKTIETQMNTPQCVMGPGPVKTECCKTVETRMSGNCFKEAAKEKKTTKRILNTCKSFYAKYRCFGCRSKKCPGKIPSKKESNCDKPLCPTNQNPATSDTCPYGLILGDQSQPIKSQQEVLNLQEPPTQPTCEKKSRCEKPFCSKLDTETQPRSQAQNIDTQMSDCAQLCSKNIGHNENNPSRPFTSSQTNKRTRESKSQTTPVESCENPCCPFRPLTSSQTNKRTQMSKSQTTSVESCKNPCCPFKGSQIFDNQTSREDCGNPEFPFEDSQTSENQTTSIDSCGSPNCPFRHSEIDRDQTTSIENCANPDCPFKDSQTDENQTTSAESCDNPCCPNRESQANTKTSSRRRWTSLYPCHDTPVNNNQPATLVDNRQPTNSCRGHNCRVKGPQIQNSATSRRTLEISQNNVQLYNNKKTHWAKSCCAINTFRSEPENMQANSFHNSKTNTHCACCSRPMIPTKMQRSLTNCRSVCCFKILQSNEHPSCINSYPSDDSQAYQSNNEKRDDYKYRPQETQTRSVETHCKPVLPYSSQLSSGKGLCLKFQPVAQSPLKCFSRPAQEHSFRSQYLPSSPQKIFTPSFNLQEVRDCSPGQQEVGDYSTSPQELQRYLVSQQCDPSVSQDGASRPQGSQGYLTTPECNPECPHGYSACAQDGASHPQGYLTTPRCDPECPQGLSTSAQDGTSRPQETQGYLTTPGYDPECPQDYSGSDQVGASHLQGMQGYPSTPRCDPNCPQRCQRPVGPPYTEGDANRPALLSRSFAQTEYPEEIKPEKREKQKKISGNSTKSKEIVQGTDYPCAQVCQDDRVPSGSAKSFNSSECANSSKSKKSPKSKKKTRQGEITPCGSYSSLAMTPCPICQQKLRSYDSLAISATSVKSSKVNSPKPARVSKQAKSVELPCGVCQQKFMSADSSSSLVISATSVKTKPAKCLKSSEPAPKSVEFPCGICQQKLLPIRRTVVKLKDPGSYKPDQEGVISVEQYEKNKKKKKKTKQLSTDVCLPICGQEEKNKKKRFQVVDCVKGSRSVKASIITCQCPKPEPPKKRSAFACALDSICTSRKPVPNERCLRSLPVPYTPEVTALPPPPTVTKGSKERVVPCVFRTKGSSKYLKKPVPCQCPPPEPGLEGSSCEQRSEPRETAPAAKRGLKVHVTPLNCT